MADQGDVDEDHRGNNQGRVGSWPTDFVKSQPFKASSVNWTDRVYHDISSINRCSSLCKLNFQLNREEIKQLWSKISSSS